MIGIFDSGVGGLSVWRELAPLLPDAHMIYLADQAHLPYGPRRIEDVRALTERCARWLVDRGCNTVVIACNTASGAALSHLRETFPQVRFVGAEPAIKPAALTTRSGVIGVLATQTTFASERYASLITRFAVGARVIEQPSPDWVMLVESGAAFDEQSLCSVEGRLEPLLDAGADVLVLGCTHFAFLKSHIQQVLAAHEQAVRVIDPGPAIAREAARQYAARQYAARQYAPHRQSGQGLLEFWTTGDAARFSALASRLLGQAIQAQTITLS
jgi:glutamate racemase